MEEYKSNSYKSRELQSENVQSKRKIEKVISGSAKTKEKNKIQRFADVFVSEDISNVKNYIFIDVLVPAIKKAVCDVVTNGVNMFLYGESESNRSGTKASRISYKSYYDKRDETRHKSNRIGNSFDYDDIIFNSRGDAEIVLNTMDDMISQFGVVSVGDLYDLADISTTNFTVNNYGWTDIRSAAVVRVKDGYMLKMPRALPLN